VNRIIFCGPFGGKKGRVGGGESGNNKTLKIFLEKGFFVKRVEKPYPFIKGFLGGVLYLFQVFVYYLRFLFSLVVSSKNTSVHITGFYGHLIYMEFFFVATAKIFSRKTVYELRAGGAVDYYLDGGYLYRFFFRKTVCTACNVLCQGKEYVTFLQSTFGIDGIYYPNYMEEQAFNTYGLGSDRSNNDAVVKLVYFGRLVASKNVEIVIEVAGNLKKKGLSIELSLIGPCVSSYRDILDKKLNEFDVASETRFLGSLASNYLFLELEKSHFFIFPTNEKREGHSNSLTEAMACGVVPVVSDFGFNRSVVNLDQLVISNIDSNMFSDEILSIWLGGVWQELSTNVRNRVKCNYLDTVVKERLVKSHVE